MSEYVFAIVLVQSRETISNSASQCQPFACPLCALRRQRHRRVARPEPSFSVFDHHIGNLDILFSGVLGSDFVDNVLLMVRDWFSTDGF